jgi:hypothetical protein
MTSLGYGSIIALLNDLSNPLPGSTHQASINRGSIMSILDEAAFLHLEIKLIIQLVLFA